MMGFTYHHKAVPAELVSGMERSIVECFRAQAAKFTALRDKIPDGDTVDTLDAIVTLLEEHDQEAGYQTLRLIGQSRGARNLTAWEGFDRLLPGLTLVAPPSFLPSIPNIDRLQYCWHREAHFYPKRRRFINAWLPLFRPKTAGNGTMQFAVGGHNLGDLPFVEHTAPHEYRQYEIPPSVVEHLPVHHVEAAPGDMVTFCPDTIHRSTPNLSDAPTYAAVLRVWDPTRDYTLSGDLAATPYGGDYGRPGLDP